MRVLVQRCDKASVTVDNKIVGSINHGLTILVGFTEGDDISDIKYLDIKLYPITSLFITSCENKL